MIESIHRVWCEIEKMEGTEGRREKVDKPVELASFHTLDEALAFRTQLQLEYSPLATGEKEVLDQMTSPKEFTPGD